MSAAISSKVAVQAVNFTGAGMVQTDAAPADAAKAEIALPKVKKGDKVNHKIWGRCVVTQIKGHGPEAVICIKVAGEERSLLARYAPLEAVSKRS